MNVFSRCSRFSVYLVQAPLQCLGPSDKEEQAIEGTDAHCRGQNPHQKGPLVGKTPVDMDPDKPAALMRKARVVLTGQTPGFNLHLHHFPGV